MRRTLCTVAAATLLLAGCASGENDGGNDSANTSANNGQTADGDESENGDSDDDEQVTDFDTETHDSFDSPWALEFLPGTDYLLVTERTGALKLRDQDSGDVTELSGVPDVVDDGQGGLHDVIAGPTFEDDQTIYLSWVQEADGGSQGVVGKGTLDAESGTVQDLEIIWEQDPASGDGHFALRMVVLDDFLYVTSGDRQELTPAQDTSNNIGAIVRLTLDGEPAPDNPFADDGGQADLWSIGHRNPLGIATDSQGNLWSSEMGPAHGDELNLITQGANYGWPEVSMGEHYDGTEIPDHADGDGFEAPAAYWVPAISPGSLLIYDGDLFTGWQDSALLGGLSGENLVLVDLDDGDAQPVQDWDMGDRVRALAQAPDGALWIATDSGDLLELRPAE